MGNKFNTYALVKNWSELENSVNATFEDSQLASKTASAILERTLRRANRIGNYNHWSGNLARSYIVQISSRKAYYLFKTKAGAGNIKAPIVISVEKGTSYDIFKRPNNISHTYFRLTKQNHKVKGLGGLSRRHSVYRRRDSIGKKKKRDELWRELRPIEEGIGAGNAAQPHWYLPKTRLRTSQKSKGVSIVIGNETPYRKFVEKKYEVLSLKEREGYKQIASDIYMKEINAVVKRTCYNLNRDVKTGRFTKG